jgi:tetratricopeptide (TPR) repeat protein
MDSTEYIDDYFNGLLNDELRQQFEQRITSDPSFAEEVAFYISSGSMLKEQVGEEKKLRFRELYEQAKTHNRILRPARSIGNWRIYAAAAVLVIAVAGLWWIFIRQTGPEQFADEYIKRELRTQGVKMSITQDSLQHALSTYNSGDFRGALQKFETILQSDTGSFRVKEYAGIACLRLGEYDKALAYFIKVEAHHELFTNSAVFYQALTLMRRNKPGDQQLARQYLQRVVDQELGGKETAAQWLEKWPQ